MAQKNGARQQVVLGMSGGVDSAVSAAILLRAGYEVKGVTCRFHDDDAADAAALDAAAVCTLLGIEHHEHNVTHLFEQKVVAPFVRSYDQGLTPSPCVGCNAQCKLPALIEVADVLGCASVATGHYARTARLCNGRSAVLTALDANKDQSYMLSLLSQNQLSRLVLPLGAMTKAEVRILATDLGLPVAEKAESQDVCFFEGSYRKFLQERGVADTPGEIVDGRGNVLGYHKGLWHFTVGQRKGIGIAAAEPYYVVAKRPTTNQVVVGFAHEATVESLRVAAVNWQAFDMLERSCSASVKLRYRSRAVPCIIEPEGSGCVRVVLRSAQPTTAPGQYAVFYEGATVLGGGMIEDVVSL